MHFNYDLNATHSPYLDKFMKNLCDNFEDRENYFLAILKSIQENDIYMQYFLYLFGTGGSGKSTFATLLTALVGENVTHTTTFKSMN
jgi:putative DNA primase/helicase